MRYRLPALLLLVLAACRESAPHRREFDGASAFTYIETQVAFGPRIPNTDAHAKMGAWLDSMLRTRSDTLVVQKWDHVTAKGDTLHLTNFIARFNPQATKRVLFLAHWDSRPISDGLKSTDKTKPVPGANDGGSGVALLLGVADALKKDSTTLGVDLLFDDGEDYGDFEAKPANDVLIGARHYAANQPPGPQPLYAVLWDMVAAKDLVIYQEGNSLVGAPEVVERVWDTARDAGYATTFIASPKYTLIDDHLELQKVGIRAIDVVGFDYQDTYWHTQYDTIDKVSAAKLQIVGDVAMALVRKEE
jgi:Zn-dependent M28 family amino/carboxypeptidase